MRRCATGGFRRTRSASLCCSGCPICSSRGAPPPPDTGSVRPKPPRGGGKRAARSRVAPRIALVSVSTNHRPLVGSFPSFTNGRDEPCTRRYRGCSDLPWSGPVHGQLLPHSGLAKAAQTGLRRPTASHLRPGYPPSLGRRGQERGCHWARHAAAERGGSRRASVSAAADVMGPAKRLEQRVEPCR